MRTIKVIALAFAASLCFSQPILASEWQIVGAGNATCHNWLNASSINKIEMHSWMAGFASAMNIDKASRNQPEWRMDLLTYDSLSANIKPICSEEKNKGKTMFDVLMEILNNFPMVK
jgi:hypothetical protein